ncbi:MAG: hypothetical protein PHU21_05725 [Elusimicrobia bacterium]|nr:hypothetical protein [Elusimicrobiota bacterium]
MKGLAVWLPAALLAGCVAVPGGVDEDHLARSQVLNQRDVFPDLDPGVNETQSQHFQARAYGSGKAMQAADLAETAYQRLMVDTGLSSFAPTAGRYKIVLYASPEEYRRKTGQPGWSNGVTVGSTIYSYEGGHLDGLLSHELSRLVFYDYVGHVNLDHRWVSEGLAVYEESKAGQPASGGVAPPMPAWPQGWQPLPLDYIIRMAPATDRDRTLSSWHLQAESLVRFMIERGGRTGFGQFLGELRQDASFDKAVAASFPGTWRDLADLYASWAKAQQ